MTHEQVVLAETFRYLQDSKLPSNIKEVMLAALGHCEYVNDLAEQALNGSQDAIHDLKSKSRGAVKNSPIENQIEELYVYAVKAIEDL